MAAARPVFEKNPAQEAHLREMRLQAEAYFAARGAAEDNSGTSADSMAEQGPSKRHKAAASPSPAVLPQFRPLHPNDTATGVANFGATGQASGDPRIIWRPPAEGVSSPPKVMTEEEAHRLAEAEGISLVLAPCNASGYKGVSRNNKPTISRNSGYCAQFCQNGKIFRLGSFSGAPEAALAYARHLKAVTAMKRRQQVEEFTRS